MRSDIIPESWALKAADLPRAEQVREVVDKVDREMLLMSGFSLPECRSGPGVVIEVLVSIDLGLVLLVNYLGGGVDC